MSYESDIEEMVEDLERRISHDLMLEGIEQAKDGLLSLIFHLAFLWLIWQGLRAALHHWDGYGVVSLGI